MKACAEDSKNFEAVARVLVDHYSGVHLREGKSLGGSSSAPRSNFRYTGKGSKPKGRSKGRAYPAVRKATKMTRTPGGRRTRGKAINLKPIPPHRTMTTTPSWYPMRTRITKSTSSMSQRPSLLTLRSCHPAAIGGQCSLWEGQR